MKMTDVEIKSFQLLFISIIIVFFNYNNPELKCSDLRSMNWLPIDCFKSVI